MIFGLFAAADAGRHETHGAAHRASLSALKLPVTVFQSADRLPDHG
jgi:hypothetical protein